MMSDIPFGLESGKTGSFIDRVLTMGIAKLGWIVV